MREQRNDPKRLKDILQAIDTIFEYVENRSMEEFLADKKSCHTGEVNPESWTQLKGSNEKRI